MAEAMVALPQSVINQLFRDIAELKSMQLQIIGKDKTVWLSEAEAAEWLGVTINTLQSYRCNGRIPTNIWRKVGRKVEYNKDKLIVHSNK